MILSLPSSLRSLGGQQRTVESDLIRRLGPRELYPGLTSCRKSGRLVRSPGFAELTRATIACARSAITLPSLRQRTGATVRRRRQALCDRAQRCGDLFAQCSTANAHVRLQPSMASFSPVAGATRRSRPSSLFPPADVRDLFSGRTNIPCLGGLSARAIQPLIAGWCGPHGARAGHGSRESARAQGASMELVLSSEVTTNLADIPSVTCVSGAGRTISKIRSFVATIPSCAEVSNANQARSAVPKA